MSLARLSGSVAVEEGGGLVGGGNAADQVDINATQELGVVGLRRRLDLLGVEALIDGLVDEMGEGGGVEFAGQRGLEDGLGRFRLVRCVFVLGVVFLVGRLEQAEPGQGDERGQKDPAPYNGSVVHAFVSRPIGCGVRRVRPQAP